MTRNQIAQLMQDSAGADWGTEAHFQRFAARLKDQMIRDGWRQCAKGQRTTQFCAMAEGAVKAEREECAKMFDGEVWAYAYREIAAAIRARK